jgi:acyl transferase domain-containing protein/acyl-CoA synthetase (AMP-forming)/AMP-acid ligase II/NADPH:quinone reductase-like Zn-dependent oxidoreductase/acyl carrier protein
MGAVAVPMAGAATEDLNLKLFKIGSCLDQPVLIVRGARRRKLEEYCRRTRNQTELAFVIEWEQLVQASAGKSAHPKVSAQDLAFLQFSSGSTGDPKGVRVTHANLLANIGSMLRACETTVADSMLSWLPLSHDMGLIGIHLMATCGGLNQYLMPTDLFVRRPMLWLESAHRHRATHLCCPNFGYQYLLSGYGEHESTHWDLSCIRLISNGAEPISVDVLRRFTAAMSRHGLRPNVIQPCYGLAEGTLAVSLGRPAENVQTWQVSRGSLAMGKAVEKPEGDEAVVSLVECGSIVDSVQVKVAGEKGEELPDETVGRILIAGESVTSGYYNNPEATNSAVREGWLDTGDLGFRSQDRLIITGRHKDLIILSGLNVYPHDVERVVEEATGVKAGTVVACGCRRTGYHSEELVIFVRERGSKEKCEKLSQQIRGEVMARMGITVSAVVRVSRIARTSSGKLQRYLLAQAWENGEFEEIRETPKREATLCAASIQQTLAMEALRISRMREIDPERALSEQGFDSLKCVELARRLSDHFNLELSPSLAFDYPSLAAIAQHMEARLGGIRDVKTRALSRATHEPIAVIGAALRLPGRVKTIDDFWDLLVRGIDAVTEIPPIRWDSSGYYDPNPEKAGTMSTRYGAFLEEIDQFDAGFFGISPEEAQEMDPQQRLLLETSWEALEHAGQNVAGWRGRQVGVFVGISNVDYARRHVNSGDLRRVGPYALTGSSLSAAAGRISYCFGFQGPSLVVDTACSSSLASVHLAARSLRSHECELALAGGVNLILDPEVHIGFSRMGAMAADGRCKAFDASADGYGRGEGCVVVVLKRVSDALAHGDPILALLRGSAMNQDGASNGFTAPNGIAQQAVMREALAHADVAPSSVAYVEAHGTGTPLGDPQEIGALAEIYQDGRNGTKLWVGSVKTNIGHLESAAGLAGFLKAALCVNRGMIPPSLHFKNPSPHIPWARLAIQVPTRAEPWDNQEAPRRAAVSSYGFTGTNVHAVLEEPPRRQRVEQVEPTALVLPLSARSIGALASLREAWIELLDRDDRNAAALCRTASLRRAFHRWRLSTIGATREALLASLRAADLPSHPSGFESPRVVFIFPGHGSQWMGMARAALAEQPVFREAIEECGNAFRAYAKWDLMQLLQAPDLVLQSQIDCIQPTLFAISIALARLWRFWGTRPQAVVGHSMGEIAAAHIAGALSLDDAVRIICLRSSLLRRISGQGSMCLVELSLDEAEREIAGMKGSVSIAASNAGNATVLSGDSASIDEVISQLARRSVFARKVKVDVASHSPHVEILREELLESLKCIQPLDTQIPFYSTVTGKVVPGKQLGPEYWMQNLRQPVLFGQSLKLLLADGFSFFAELSPHPILSPFVEQAIATANARAIVTGSLRRDANDTAELYAALGRAWQAGCMVDWKKIYGKDHSPSELPSYPWQHTRYWIERPKPYSENAMYPTMRRAAEIAGRGEVLYESEISLKEYPGLAHHCVQGAAVFPATAFLELVVRTLGRDLPVQLEQLRFVRMLVLAQNETCVLQLQIRGNKFSFHSRKPADAQWVLNCEGQISDNPPTLATHPVTLVEPSTFIHGDDLYGKLRYAGLDYGPDFRLVESLRSSSFGIVAEISSCQIPVPCRFAPAVLDACFHGLALATPDSTRAWVPERISEIVFHSLPEKNCQASIVLGKSEVNSISADITVSDDLGHVAITAKRLVVRAIEEKKKQKPYVCSVAWGRISKSPAIRSCRQVAVFSNDISLRLQLEAVANLTVVDMQNLSGKEEFSRAISNVGPDCDEIVYLAPRQADSRAAWDTRAALQETVKLMQFIQALDVHAGSQLRLKLLSRAASGAPELENGCDPVQSAVCGFFRSVRREYPEFRPISIDLSAEFDVDELHLALADWPDDDAEMAIRGDQVFVPRLKELKAEGKPNEAWRAVIDSPGDLGTLAFLPTRQRDPGPEEVEIQVEATGINFLNVLSGMGLYPGYQDGFRSLGIECAGRILRCGDGVNDFEPGDEVFGIAEHCLASHVNAPAALLARNPALPFQQAAGLPVAYLTARWSLERLAKLEKGEAVLIHSASGGVGRAAIEIARQIGARIFATAGSEARREALRVLDLEGIFDSRRTDFAREVREATGGCGVDVVLNSLTGEAIEAGLKSLAPFGRFVEIGKVEFYGEKQVALKNFRDGISYFSVDLDRIAQAHPQLLGTMLRDLAGALKRGELPPLPVQEFSFSRASEALQVMAQASHQAKIVLIRGQEEIPLRHEFVLPNLRDDATYLVTGGTGAIGIQVAEWLLEQGARHLVLAARRAPAAIIQNQIERWNREGARVCISTCDVADQEKLATLLKQIDRDMPPLRGIVHAAGCLADALVTNLDRQSVEAVFAGKAGGALHLHHLTQDRLLDFFILMSSAAAGLGPAAQANYAAANAWLGSLVALRRQQGLPAVAVALGPVAGEGLAAASVRSRSATSFENLPMLKRWDVGRLIFEAAASNASHPFVLDLDGFHSQESLFSELPIQAPSTHVAQNLTSSIRALASNQERYRAVEECLVKVLIQVLGRDRNEIETNTDFKSLGLDSLMAMQVRNRLNNLFDVKLPITTFWNYPTPAQYAGFLLKQFNMPGEPPARPTRRTEDDRLNLGVPLPALELMSEAEAERRLLERLS